MNVIILKCQLRYLVIYVSSGILESQTLNNLSEVQVLQMTDGSRL